MKKNKYIIIGLLMIFLGVFITFDELIVDLYREHFMIAAFFNVVMGVLIGLIISKVK